MLDPIALTILTHVAIDHEIIFTIILLWLFQEGLFCHLQVKVCALSTG